MSVLVAVLAGFVTAPVAEGGETRRKLGIYRLGAPEEGMRDISSFESRLGRRVDIVQWYQQWGTENAAFVEEYVRRVASDGRIPLLTWEPREWGGADQPAFTTQRIASGAWDAYIERWAHALRRYGGKIYLRPMHEPDASSYPWSTTLSVNSPQSYVAAWRRIVDIFRRAGAYNVRWVWSVIGHEGIERWYPGTRYVDRLALDGYNGGTALAWGGWRSFRSIFLGPYTRITKLGPQPVWITETATTASGGNKLAWIRSAVASLKYFPRVCALIWFDRTMEADWELPSNLSPGVFDQASLGRCRWPDRPGGIPSKRVSSLPGLDPALRGLTAQGLSAVDPPSSPATLEALKSLVVALRRLVALDSIEAGRVQPRGKSSSSSLGRRPGTIFDEIVHRVASASRGSPRSARCFHCR